jgi:hypothetical protein
MFNKNGTFEYRVIDKKYYVCRVHVNLFREPDNRLETLLHEIGHLVTIILYHKYRTPLYGGTKVVSKTKMERDASRYAVRVLKLLKKDKDHSRKYLLRAYETYVAAINCDKAEESYKGLKSFGVKY